MSAMLYYDEVIYLIMLMMWVCAAIGTIVFLYVIWYVCLSALDKLGKYLYKKLGPVDNWFLTTDDCEDEEDKDADNNNDK